MSLWRRDRVSVGVGAEAVVARRGDATVERKIGADSSLRSAAQSALVELGGKGKAVVFVAGSLCRHWTQSVPAGVGSLRELGHIAALRCAQLFGGQGGDWAVVGDWRLGAPFICAALPRAVVEDLRGVAASSGRRLNMQSAVLAAVRKVEPFLGRDGWHAWQAPGVTVIVERQGGRVVWLRAARADDDVPGCADAAWAEVRRECLSRGQALPDELSWLGTDGSATAGADRVHRLNVHDALPPATARGDAAWAAALAAAA